MLVTHSQKRPHRLALSRLSRVAVIVFLVCKGMRVAPRLFYNLLLFSIASLPQSVNLSFFPQNIYIRYKKSKNSIFKRSISNCRDSSRFSKLISLILICITEGSRIFNKYQTSSNQEQFILLLYRTFIS